MLSTPKKRLREELAQLTVQDSSTVDLAAGGPAALEELGQLLERYFRAAVGPHWAAVRARVQAERAEQIRSLADGGVEALLAGLPSMRWRFPVLEVDYAVDRDLHLNGRGLTLVPAYFNWGPPVALADPDLTPLLVYSPRATGGSDVECQRDLAALLGPTRAEVLRAIAPGCTTTELAHQTCISPATASHHATVLRNAGLIDSHRHANQVLHRLSPLGMALLRRSGPDTLPPGR